MENTQQLIKSLSQTASYSRQPVEVQAAAMKIAAKRIAEMADTSPEMKLAQSLIGDLMCEVRHAPSEGLAAKQLAVSNGLAAKADALLAEDLDQSLAAKEAIGALIAGQTTDLTFVASDRARSFAEDAIFAIRMLEVPARDKAITAMLTSLHEAPRNRTIGCDEMLEGVLARLPHGLPKEVYPEAVRQRIEGMACDMMAVFA